MQIGDLCLDCALMICKYLDLQEQINVATVCPNFFVALKDLYWSKVYKTLHVKEILDKSNVNTFLEALNDKVVDIILEGDMTNKGRYKEILKIMNFPDADTMQLSFVGTRLGGNFDDLLPLVAKSCPNVIQLQLCGQFSCNNVLELKKLKHLKLICSPHSFKAIETKKMFKSLKLERVLLESFEFHPNSGVNRNKETELLRYVLKCKTIEEIYVSHSYMTKKYMNGMIKKLKNLRKVAFKGRETDVDEVPIYRLPLIDFNGQICSRANGVIVNGNWINLLNEPFIKLISRLKNLRLLSFCNADINLDFLRRIIGSRLKKTQKLKIHCYNTQVNEDDLDSLSSTHNVEFSLAEYKNNSLDIYNIEFLFQMQ